MANIEQCSECPLRGKPDCFHEIILKNCNELIKRRRGRMPATTEFDLTEESLDALYSATNCAKATRLKTIIEKNNPALKNQERQNTQTYAK